MKRFTDILVGATIVLATVAVVSVIQPSQKTDRELALEIIETYMCDSLVDSGAISKEECAQNVLDTFREESDRWLFSTAMSISGK